jgi:hypothetical protein
LKKTSLTPLRGNNSTHLRQNYAQAKSANNQPKLENHKELPRTHVGYPWTNATPPGRMHANHLMRTEQLHQLSSDRSDRSTPPVKPVLNMCTRPALWLIRPVTTTGQTGDILSPVMAQYHMKTFQMHSVAHNMLKLLPLLTMHESSQKCKKCNLELLK